MRYHKEKKNMEVWSKAQCLEKEWWSQETTLKKHTSLVRPSHGIARASKEFWGQYVDILRRNNIFPEQFQRVLDVGCGPTGILMAIDATMKCGVDTLIGSYKQLYKLDQSVNYFSCMGEALCFQKKSMDIVFCINALDHCAHPRKVLAEIRRVLKSEGHFMLVVSTYSDLRFISVLAECILKSRLLGKAILHPHTFSKKKMLALLDEAGFSVIETCDSEVPQNQIIYLCRCY